jgi:hypothetical protein
MTAFELACKLPNTSTTPCSLLLLLLLLLLLTEQALQ